MIIYGRIVEDFGVHHGFIEIEDGTIVRLVKQQTIPQNAIVYSDDHLIFPGFVDVNTHCREDTSQIDSYKENFKTAGYAALNGGVTFLCDMPDNPVPPIDDKSYKLKSDLAKTCPVDTLLYAGIGPDTSPLNTKVPYKVYIGKCSPKISDDSKLYFEDMHALDSTLSRYRNQHVSFSYKLPHEITQFDSKSTTSNEVLEFCIGLIDKYNIKGSLSNLLPNGLKIVESARKVGNHIRTEISSGYLVRSNDFLYLSVGGCEELSDVINNRQIDFLVSGHSPNYLKENWNDNWPNEIPGLDTYGGLVAWLIAKRNIDPVRIFEMSCMSPGAWVSQFISRPIGRLLPGYEANITVLSMNRSMVDSRCLYSKCKWSPFDLRLLPGSVEAVYLKGTKVVDGIYMKNF